MSLLKRLTSRDFLVGAGAIALSAMVVGTVARAYTTSGPVPDPSTAPKVGALAPAFTVTDTRGATHSLEAYKGRWVVLDWFNHGCPATKQHYKSFEGKPGNTQAMQRDYAGRVVWLSVVSSAPGRQGFTSVEKADELTREKGATPTAVIRDTEGTLGRLYGARNTPQYAIIDAEGVLRYSGAIDNNPSSNVKAMATATNYVRAALDAGLAGNPIEVSTSQPYGCDVKY